MGNNTLLSLNKPRLGPGSGEVRARKVEPGYKKMR